MSDEVEDQRSSQRKAQEAAAGLWPIRRSLAVAISVAILGLAAVTVTTVVALPAFATRQGLHISDFLDLLKLAFAGVGGIAAVFALVMSYRKQRLAEAAQVLAERGQALAEAAEDREARVAVATELRERQRSADDLTRVFNERFANAAGQLGDDEPAIRLAGVYAMAGLADDWEEGRQTCIDVLCGQLRMPYAPDPGDEAPLEQSLAFRRNREVRHAIISLITAHLKVDATTGWHGYNFDFSGAVFDGGKFGGAAFTGGSISFNDAQFVNGTVDFDRTIFSGGTISFDDATFSGGLVTFFGAAFIGSKVSFIRSVFSGSNMAFAHTKFVDGKVTFGNFVVSDGYVSFSSADFTGDTAIFYNGAIYGGNLNFRDCNIYKAHLDRTLYFLEIRICGGRIDFSKPGHWEVAPNFENLEIETQPGILLPGTSAPHTE